MPKTATEVEVKKTTAARNKSAATRSQEQRKPRRGLTAPLIITPLTLLAVSGAAYLLVRRWTDNSDDGRRI
jgi:hypothetical protein